MSLKTITNAVRLDDTKPVYTEAEMYNAIAYAMASAYVETKPATAMTLAALSGAKGTIPQEHYSTAPKEIVAAEAAKSDLRACILEATEAAGGVPAGYKLDVSSLEKLDS